MNMHYMDTNEYITMTMILSIIDQVCFDKCQKSGHHIQAARITQMNADARDIIAFFLQMNADASDQNTAQLSLS